MLSTSVSDPLPVVTGAPATGTTGTVIGAAICDHGPAAPGSEYQLPLVFS